jgi:glycosyltransferase A (GT-A) superfamily protein (DUF2064 family)
MAAAFRDLHALRTRTPTVVLGPAMDGGYYLIGLQRPVDGLFQGVALEYRRRSRADSCARALRLSVHLLDPWYDIDDEASLLRAVVESGPSRIRTWWQSHYGP